MLKYLLLIISFFLSSFSISAEVQVNKKNGLTHYQFNIDSVQVSSAENKGVEFKKISLLGTENYQGVFGKVGNPEIPVIRLVVNVKDKRDINISWNSDNKKSTPLMHPLFPVQESYSKSEKNPPKFEYNKKDYKTFSMDKMFSTEFVGSFNGSKRVMITLFPFSYDSKTSSYQLIKQFDVTVKEMSREREGEESILFVVGRAFEKSEGLKRYIKFKKLMGYRVFIHQINRINKKPKKIRAKIQKVYNTSGVNLKYVLLIGDDKDVPGQKAKFIMGSTDHFYRSIDTDDYYTDINGPDLGVGRISAKNKKQLDSIFLKLTKYQMGEFTDESWLEHISFIATDDRYKIAEASHNYAIETYTAPLNYIGHYPNDPQLGGDKLYAITEHATAPKVVKHISEGRFIINYSGHGSVKTWAGPRVSQSNVRKMDHSDARPFVISNACITGQFQIKECFAETWLRDPEGAVMMWASMDSTYWEEDDVLERAMYDAIFKLKLQNFNKITQYALGKFFTHFGPLKKGNYYWETYHQFGDPSIRLRDGHTVNVNVEGDLVSSVGSKSHTLLIKSSEGNPLVEARVSLYGAGEKGEVFITATTSETGEVKLPLSKISQEMNLKLSVYGHNTKFFVTDFSVLKAK